MPAPETIGVSRVWLRTDLVTIGDVRHVADDPALRVHHRAVRWPTVAFPRLTLQVAFAGHEPFVGDANTAMLCNVGHEFRRMTLGGRGTCEEWIDLRPDALQGVIARYDPSAADRPLQPFPFVSAPAPTRAFAAQRLIFAMLQREGGVDHLAADELALTIVNEVVAAAFSARGPAAAGPRTYAGPRRMRRLVVREVIELLHSRLAQGISLDELATAAGFSPFHLCRVFREETGCSIHRYLTRLRLRAALDRLVDSDQKSREIAEGVGFASESHLSDSFQREFGLRPSIFRRAAKSGCITQARRRLAAATN